jgi:acyl dehydratase
VRTPRPEDLPQVFPFRLAERAEAVSGKRSAVAMATADGAITRAAHWPVTLVAEALAQAALLLGSRAPHPAGPLVALDRVRVLRPVAAGEKLEIEIVDSASFGSMRRVTCRALAAGALAATAEITVGEREERGGLAWT